MKMLRNAINTAILSLVGSLCVINAVSVVPTWASERVQRAEKSQPLIFLGELSMSKDKTVSSAATKERLTLLNDPALRRILHGHYVQRLDMAKLSDVGGLEYFCANGSWHEEGGRTRPTGRFSISDSTVCIEYKDGSKDCRRYYVDSAGHYFYGPETALSEITSSQLVPVEISAGPSVDCK